MAKNVDSKPLMFVEKFVPQAYCETCTNQKLWKAQCTDMSGQGYIFYDDNVDDGIVIGVDNVLHDTTPHGGCTNTHIFEQETPPTFNAWVLKNSKIHWNIEHYCTQRSDGKYLLKEEYFNRLEPALVKGPGEALDHNWLVCYNLQSVKNPGS